MTKSEAARYMFMSEAAVDALLRSGELASLDRGVVQRYRKLSRARQRKFLMERAREAENHGGTRTIAGVARDSGEAAWD